MRCEDVEHDLGAYLDGELGPEAAKELERHLRICAPCRKARAALDAVDVALDGLGVPAGPAPGLVGRVRARIEAEASGGLRAGAGAGGSPSRAGGGGGAGGRGAPARWPGALAPRTWGLAAAAALVLAAGGAAWLRWGGDPRGEAGVETARAKPGTPKGAHEPGGLPAPRWVEPAPLEGPPAPVPAPAPASDRNPDPLDDGEPAFAGGADLDPATEEALLRDLHLLEELELVERLDLLDALDLVDDEELLEALAEEKG